MRLPAGDPPRTAVVVIHGFKGFRGWGFFPHTCGVLARDGHAVVSVDFSRNGVVEGSDAFDDLEAFARNTFTRELDEIHRVLREVRDGGLGPGTVERVGLLGHSRGGGSAVLAAAEDAGIGALVTWAAVASFDRWTADDKRKWRSEGRLYVSNARTGQEMPLDVGLLEDFEANRARLDIVGAAGRLKAPWLIVHGDEDEAVPVHEARRLAEAAPGADLEVVPGGGHTFGAVHPLEAVPPHLERVLERTRTHFREHLATGLRSDPGPRRDPPDGLPAGPGPDPGPPSASRPGEG